jgi:hypothetical protein
MSSFFTSRVNVTLPVLMALAAVPLAAQTIDRLEGKKVSIAQTSFKGRSAIQVMAAPDAANAASYAIVKERSNPASSSTI